jgi:hypothetical protein
LARDEKTLSLISGLLETAGWKALREQALKKVVSHEESLNRLLFRTRTAIDPVEVEYFRGFRQGVMYVLDGLPNAISAEFERGLKEDEN